MKLNLTTIDASFLPALREASKTTDEESLRYALSCLQLDGSAGTITATDGKQLLRFGGFAFPWPDRAILVRTNKLFRLGDFWKLNPVKIGLTNDSLVIRAERWQFEFPIVREGRFPNVDAVIPKPKSASNRIRLEGRDRAFLLDLLPQLPGGNDDFQPLTLDLNGHVAVVGRSRTVSQDRAAVILDRSVHLGPDFNGTFDRVFLQRALELGAEEFYLTPEGPLLATADNLQYVCMGIGNASEAIDWDSIQRIHSRPTVRA